MDLRTMHIGQKIKKLRELKNLTQTHVAEKLGVSQSAYSKIELGESEVTFNRLEKISEVLEMKPEEVIAFNESMVFNVMNNQNGGNVFGDINNTVSDTERQLYQDQINLLKEEVAYLKKMLSKFIN
ncbi:MAG TPA: XRE family transcriptional regulator [Crocinitomicaceae bacterium]|nr:XRE family transcriptional regulator [Crocinitomicaceae bacterium]